MSKLTIGNVLGIWAVVAAGFAAGYGVKARGDQNAIAVAAMQDEINELDSQSDAQAISLGKIEAGIGFLQQSFDKLESR